MGLPQGPRLMARTTKSPIRRNHWVPLGCRGHLGSLNVYIFKKSFLMSFFLDFQKLPGFLTIITMHDQKYVFKEKSKYLWA